ncbi:hypothetical protein BDZ45DRAFT_743197 [Acephala macrosclerotiorum]|nr:hypothetical protein BDZ45DRAFT_743197 [Acephala macrosclerotiorum]
MGVTITRDEARAREARRIQEPKDNLPRSAWAQTLRKFLCVLISITVLYGIAIFIQFLADDYELASDNYQPIICSPTFCYALGAHQKCDNFKSAWTAKSQGEELIVAKDLDYVTRLGELQKLGADSTELPFYLQVGEGTVGDFLVDLSNTSKPMLEKCKPLLKRFQNTAQIAIDGLQETPWEIDELVSNITYINRWASYVLGNIKEADMSIENTLRRIYGPVIGVQSNLTEVAFLQEFLSMTSRTKKFISKVALSCPSQVKAISKLKLILEDIAIIGLRQGTKLDYQRLKDNSYWNFLFRRYEAKLRRGNLDEIIAVYATFYRHTLEAQKFASSSQAMLQTIHREVGELQEKLVKASPATLSGQREFLQQYVDMLNVGVEALEASKAETSALQKEKMQNLKDLVKPF